MIEPQSQRQEVVLYHVPPSFYSQIVRLVLAEKGVDHKQVIVAPGPPTYDSYHPWYMRLNPMGTVPTLVVNGEAIDDSRLILKYVEQHFDGPTLLPEDASQREEVERWISEAYQIPERVLAYGSEKLKSMGERTNRGRLRALQKWRSKTPQMAAVYDVKIADIESFMREAADTKHVASINADTQRRLDALNTQLSQQPFCCGESYTQADVVWTVTVARQLMMGLDPFEARPALDSWFKRMRARPSFNGADIWTRFKPEVMLPILLVKLKWHVLAVLTVAGLLTAAVLYLLSL